MPPSRSKQGRGLGPALAVSVLVHAGIAAFVLPYIAPTPGERAEVPDREATSEEPEPMRVEVVSEPEEPKPEEPEEPTEPEEKPTPERRETEKREREEEKPEENPERESYNRKSVVQETNEESPEDAEFVSENANKVEEQTRAEETVEEFTKPSESEAESKETESESTEETPEKKRGAREAVASRARKPAKPPPRPSEPNEEQRERDETEPTEPKEGKGPDAAEQREETEADQSQEARPERPPMPTLDDYSKIFDEGEDRERRRERREKGVGSEMFREIEKSEGSVRATLENYIPEVRPGNHTSVNAAADEAATYINRIHSKIHPRWGGSYLPRLDRRYGASHPLSDTDLNAELEFVIDGSSGELKKVTIVSSSGITSYDMEAATIAKQVAPHTEPPDPLVSPDGNVYLHWNFWRDQRQCGTFGVSLYKLNGEGEREKRGGGEPGQ